MKSVKLKNYEYKLLQLLAEKINLAQMEFNQAISDIASNYNIPEHARVNINEILQSGIIKYKEDKNEKDTN